MPLGRNSGAYTAMNFSQYLTVISSDFSAELERVPSSEGPFALTRGVVLFCGLVKAQHNLASLTFKNDMFGRKTV
jgi:hypothetical protein